MELILREKKKKKLGDNVCLTNCEDFDISLFIHVILTFQIYLYQEFINKILITKSGFGKKINKFKKIVNQIISGS